MRGLFFNAYAFNADVSNWDTSSVTSTSHMFYSASAFDQDITAWSNTGMIAAGYDGSDVGSGTDPYNLSGMFSGAAAWLAKFERIDGNSGEDGRALLTRPLFSSTFHTFILRLKSNSR